jgi:hypothetical protein
MRQSSCNSAAISKCPHARPLSLRSSSVYLTLPLPTPLFPLSFALLLAVSGAPFSRTGQSASRKLPRGSCCPVEVAFGRLPRGRCFEKTSSEEDASGAPALVFSQALQMARRSPEVNKESHQQEVGAPNRRLQPPIGACSRRLWAPASFWSFLQWTP